MCKKKNESEFRNEIMAKYMNREFMSKEELSYLDLTSNLTEKFIDHKFYANMVKVVSKKAILQLEKDLVNQILDNYIQIKKYIEHKRNQFLKIERKKHGNNYTGLNLLSLNVKLNNFKEKMDLKKWLNKNVGIARRKEMKLIRNVRLHCSKYEVDIHDMRNYIQDKKSKKKVKGNGFFLKKKKKDGELEFAGNMKVDWLANKKKIEDFESRNCPKIIQSTMFGTIPEKDLIRRVHPISKILISETEGYNQKSKA